MNMKSRLLNLNVFISKEIQYMLERDGYSEGDKLHSEREVAKNFAVELHNARAAAFSVSSAFWS